MNPIYITQPLIPDINDYNSYLKSIFKFKYLSNNGPYVKLLEDKLKRILKVQNNSIFCNGTTALMIALKSLNLRGSVITTPFTFPATSNSLIWNNLTPIFCDVDYETMNITPKSVEERIDRSVSAILPVHIFGNPCDVYGFEELSEIYSLKLIYDAAHAFKTEINGQGIGTFGDITMFSFHPTKLFHTGEGGMLTYNDNYLDEPIKQLRNFGIKDDITGSILPGINGKMNEIQAGLGLCILDKIEEEIKKRKKIYELYKNYLSGNSWIKLLNIEKNIQNSYQYFPIRIKNFRNEVYEDLKRKKIFSRKYFYPLCSDFEHFKHIRAKVPNAVKISEEILCLPFYGDLSPDDIERICETIIVEGYKK